MERRHQGQQTLTFETIGRDKATDTSNVITQWIMASASSSGAGSEAADMVFGSKYSVRSS